MEARPTISHTTPTVPDLHCPLGTLTRTPARGSRGSILALPGAPSAGPSDDQGAAGLGLHREEGEGAHSIGKAVSSPSGVQSYSISFIFERWQCLYLSTVSFSPPLPAQSAMSNFNLVANYFSVQRVIHHPTFFSPILNFKRFWSLPLQMQRCKFIIFLFLATHFARVSACALTRAELSVSLYTLPAGVKFKICSQAFQVAALMRYVYSYQ